MLNSLLKEPLFQITVTLAVYLIINRLYFKFQLFFLNPLLLASLVIIYVLKYSGISYEQYSKGGDMVTFLLGPATVALGLPLYRQIPLIRANLKAIFAGVVAGSVTAITSSVLIAKALGASRETIVTLAAKSTTMPIALGITKILGGNDKLIVFAVVVTGVFGGVIGAEIMKLARIKSKIAIGIGIGTASHAGGTAKALLMGETEGSMSSAAIVLTGLVTALLAPSMIRWFI